MSDATEREWGRLSSLMSTEERLKHLRSTSCRKGDHTLSSPHYLPDDWRSTLLKALSVNESHTGTLADLFCLVCPHVTRRLRLWRTPNAPEWTTGIDPGRPMGIEGRTGEGELTVTPAPPLAGHGVEMHDFVHRYEAAAVLPVGEGPGDCDVFERVGVGRLAVTDGADGESPPRGKPDEVIEWEV